MYRRLDAEFKSSLVHPGGPFWAKQDNGAWSIPKGEYEKGEDDLYAAQREFHEETGFTAQGVFLALGEIKQAGGKTVAVWVFEGDCDPQHLKSNLCQIEWPPRSKRLTEIPEVDRGGRFSIPEAKMRILKSQQPLLEILCKSLHQSGQRGCSSE